MKHHHSNCSFRIMISTGLASHYASSRATCVRGTIWFLARRFSYCCCFLCRTRCLCFDFVSIRTSFCLDSWLLVSLVLHLRKKHICSYLQGRMQRSRVRRKSADFLVRQPSFLRRHFMESILVFELRIL